MTVGHEKRGVVGGSATGPAPLGDGLSGAPTPDELAHEWEAAKPPPAGLFANLGAALLVLAVGAVGVVGSLSLGLGSVRSPAAGTWPFVISVVLVGLGVALALLSRRTLDTERFTGASWAVLAGLATMVLFAMLIGTIGFEIPALLLAFAWLRFLGRETWRASVVGSLLMVAAFYLLFVVALGVSIPHLF